MAPEQGIRQRDIVGRRIAFSDAERFAKYTLPFIDANWKIPFTVLDLIGSPPRVLEGAVYLDGERLRTPLRERELKAIESVPLERIAVVVHFDPWWAFRGVSGVDRRWIEAIFATNITHPFHHGGKDWKVHDLAFSDGIGRLEGLVAKDDLFHAATFHPGDIDLLGLGPKAKRPHSWAAAPAKVL